ncbi:MAG: hypothetical protein JJT82_09510 [Legionellaceae bacterium]|nr:hypothetical protein [Legionellaceae bacterium]
MESKVKETSLLIDPENRLKDIYERLCELFDRPLSKKEIDEMVKPWGNYVRGYNRATTIDAEEEREQLKKIIKKLNTGHDALNELKEFDMHRFNPRLNEQLIFGKSNSQNDAILLIEEQIRIAKETHAFTLQKNNTSINQQRLESMAMVSLFVHANKKYGLKPLDKVGRSNKNPVLEFVRIISGIEGDEKINRHYAKYKKWQENPDIWP